VMLLVGRVAWPARRLASAAARRSGTPAATGPRSRLTAWSASVATPVTAAVGMRLALEPGRGRTAVPVRSALAGTALSVLAVTAALTFGASLLHLVNSPPLYGKRWDAAIDVQFATISPAAAEHRFGRLPGIAGWTFGQHGIIEISGHVIPAIGLAAETAGAILTPQAVLPGAPPGFQFVLLSFTPGPGRGPNIASFQRSMTSFCQTIQQSTCVVTSQHPNGVTNYASIDRVPAVLAALLAVVGMAVLGQFIVVSGRRRRRDFAIFKALGMLRRQISATIAWQVSTLTGLALLAACRSAWRLGGGAGRFSPTISAFRPVPSRRPGRCCS
jgi:hypothetical protein